MGGMAQTASAGRRPPARRAPPGAWFLAALAFLVLASAPPAQGLGPLPRPLAGAELPATQAERDLFAMPQVAAELGEVQRDLEAADTAGAAARLDRLIARHPTLAALQASRAALFLMAGEPEAALDHLEAAIGLGFADLAPLVADPLFAPLAAMPETAERLAALSARADALPPPAPPTALPLTGTAPVEAANTGWDPATGRLEARFDAAALPRGRAVLGRQRGDNAYDLLRELYRRGQAAGNGGDLYDNRDRFHSRLPPANHPQLSAVAYGAAARVADIDYGLADRIRFNRPTFGNSSTAITRGPFWRSLVRDALTRPDGAGPLRLYETYAANHLYVYPSHRDYGPERGDLFPANTPYAIVSRGSSHSDLPFLEAVAMILAAFRPDTKERLIAENLVAPTVQYVFRRSQRSVLSREAYFSGAAHPSVFPAYEIGLARMVSLANSIEPGAIPPMVRLAVLEEDAPREGVDFFGQGLSEQFFDTPSAIGRIWRGKAYTRRFLLSAEATSDPNDRPLAFHWHLLHGDPDRVRITPLAGGGRARVEIDWQEPRPVSETDPVLAARVDIGVFADNGAHDSAPALFSLLFPAHETRRYAPGPDGAMRIAMIDHADPAKAGTYADPMLMPRADWRDDYRYAADGRPLGWTRSRPERIPEPYGPDGARILVADADGRPLTGERVAYPLARDDDGTLRVEERSTGAWIDYRDGVTPAAPATLHDSGPSDGG
jgi:hypothetical protein